MFWWKQVRALCRVAACVMEPDVSPGAQPHKQHAERLAATQLGLSGIQP